MPLVLLDAMSTEPTTPLLALLTDFPRGHDLRARPLGDVNAECRNKRSKDWRNVARWRISTTSYDDLGPSWAETSEFRVRLVPSASEPDGG